MNREGAARTGTAIRINVEDVYGGMIASRARNARELAPLAASIARHGLLQPIVVRRNRTAGRYALVCGARRLAACQMLGIREIDALLIEADEQEAAACFMEEHLTREPPPLLGEAEVVGRAGGEEIYARCALPASRLARYAKMLCLSERVRAQVEAGALTLEQAEPLLAISGEERQLEAASIIAERALTPGQARRLVFGESGLTAMPPKRRAVRAAMEEAERIARRLGGQGIPAGVSVHAKDRGLCIEIRVRTGDSFCKDQEKGAFGESCTPKEDTARMSGEQSGDVTNAIDGETEGGPVRGTPVKRR
ncbi:MAG: ParB/RepB/Spo0J family partition protein, partial [Clostridia bacterium]|nr:ParB/RepB/Spo0J family partition protein [Clostridia bacterium]